MTFNQFADELELEAQLDREENPEGFSLPEDDTDAQKEDDENVMPEDI